MPVIALFPRLPPLGNSSSRVLLTSDGGGGEAALDGWRDGSATSRVNSALEKHFRRNWRAGGCWTGGLAGGLRLFVGSLKAKVELVAQSRAETGALLTLVTLQICSLLVVE